MSLRTKKRNDGFLNNNIKRKAVSWLIVLAMIFSLAPNLGSAAYADTNVAKIGKTTYTSLQEALDAAIDGEIVVLTADAGAGERVNYSGPGSVALNLGGYTYKGSVNASAGELTVYNGTVDNAVSSGGSGSKAISDSGSGKIAQPKGSFVTGSATMKLPKGYKITVSVGAGGSCEYMFDRDGNGEYASSEREKAVTGIYLALAKHVFTATPEDTKTKQANIDGGTAVVTRDSATGSSTGYYKKLNAARTMNITFGTKYFTTTLQMGTPFGGSVTAHSTDEHGVIVDTSIERGKTKAEASVAYERAQTFEITPASGYRLLSVEIDGVVKEIPEDKQKSTYTHTSWTHVKKDHVITANFEKTALFLMIDAGHFGYYNKGVAYGYWESKRMWKLHNYLLAELREYPGIIAGRTRENQAKDLGLESRGQKSAGYDLFLSCHSNSGGSKYALAIVSSTQNTYTESRPVGVALAKTVQSVMNTGSYQIWTRKQSDGREWFGVLRGAASVGTPGIILEHSFHDNKSVCKWLMSNSNLKKLAAKEAATIASMYGLTKSGNVAVPKKVTGIGASSAGYRSITVKWDKNIAATGYQIHRSESKDGTYTRIKTVTNKSTLKFTDATCKTGKTYYYKVRAVRSHEMNGSTKSKYGAYSAIKSAKAVPAKPALALLAGAGTMRVTWSAVKGADGYEIYMASSKSGTYNKIYTSKNAFGPFNCIGLKSKKNYYFKARAYTNVDGTKVYGKYSTVAYKKTK